MVLLEAVILLEVVIPLGNEDSSERSGMKQSFRILSLISIPLIALGSYGLVSAEPILPHLRSPHVVVKRSPDSLTSPSPAAPPLANAPALIQVTTPLGTLYITLHPSPTPAEPW